MMSQNPSRTNENTSHPDLREPLRVPPVDIEASTPSAASHRSCCRCRCLAWIDRGMMWWLREAFRIDLPQPLPQGLRRRIRRTLCWITPTVLCSFAGIALLTACLVWQLEILVEQLLDFFKHLNPKDSQRIWSYFKDFLKASFSCWACQAGYVFLLSSIGFCIAAVLNIRHLLLLFGRGVRTEEVVLRRLTSSPPAVVPAGTECCICLDASAANDHWQRISCGHAFHKRCLIEWLQRSRVCPLCRLDLHAAYLFNEV